MSSVHPAIVHFPIALVAFSVLTDLVAYLKNSESPDGPKREWPSCGFYPWRVSSGNRHES